MNESDLALLGALGDYLIPAGANLPSATAADVPQIIVDWVYQVLPDRRAMIENLLTKVRRDGIQLAVTELAKSNRAEYDLVCETVAGAYFMNPEVLRLIHYPGQVPVLATREVADLEFLTAAVLQGGFAPRAAPD